MKEIIKLSEKQGQISIATVILIFLQERNRKAKEMETLLLINDLIDKIDKLIKD